MKFYSNTPIGNNIPRMRVNKHKNNIMTKTKFYLFIGLTALIIIGYPICYYMANEVVTITVNEKDRITTGQGETLTGKFLIYTENEVFENTDSWSYFKFNSTDVQNDLKVDSTYTVKVAGWRIPFMSSYRNIVSIDE